MLIFLKKTKTCYIFEKNTPKWYKILEKSASDTLLERFGDPPGAKIPQERHQEQNLMKNVQFLGAPWGPKWN